MDFSVKHAETGVKRIGPTLALSEITRYRGKGTYRGWVLVRETSPLPCQGDFPASLSGRLARFPVRETSPGSLSGRLPLVPCQGDFPWFPVRETCPGSLSGRLPLVPCQGDFPWFPVRETCPGSLSGRLPLVPCQGDSPGSLSGRLPLVPCQGDSPVSYRLCEGDLFANEENVRGLSLSYMNLWTTWSAIVRGC